MEIVRGTGFDALRKDICQNACIYNHTISPFCKNVLMDAGNFFGEFYLKYKTPEDLDEYLDLLVDDVADIQKGFEMCEDMHDPVRKHAI